MLKRLTLIALFLTLAAPAMAQGQEVIKFALGANGAWYDNEARPTDFELGGNAAASFTPHLSAVGAAYYGLEHSYLRGSVGFRITSTDVNDPDFSVGIGFQYHASSDPAVRAEEWAPDVTVGWRAWPEQLPRVVLVGQASYGMDTNQAALLVGARYALGATQ